MAHTPDMHQSQHSGATGAHGAAASADMAEALARGYEPHDISLRGVFLFLIALVLTMIVVILLMYGVMNLFVEHDRASDPVGSPVVIDHPPVPMPLQPSPRHDKVDRIDMKDMRDQTNRILSGSGTSPAGRRYISIDDAMDQVVSLLPKAPPSNNGGAAQ